MGADEPSPSLLGAPDCYESGRLEDKHLWRKSEKVEAIFFEYQGRPMAIGRSVEMGLTLHRILSPDDRPAVLADRARGWEVLWFEERPLFAKAEVDGGYLVTDRRPPHSRVAILFGTGNDYGAYDCPRVLWSFVSLKNTTYSRVASYACGVLVLLALALFGAEQLGARAARREFATALTLTIVWLLVALGGTLFGGIYPYL